MTPTIDRRGFIKLSGSALAAISTTGGTALAQTTNALGYQDIAWLIGPASNRPTPSGSFFDNKRNYHYLYWATDTGARYELIEGDASWSAIPMGLPGYAVGSLPTDLASGSVVFDDNRGVPTWWDRDNYERPSFVDTQDVLVSPVTVANTASKTEVFSIEFNPDSLIQGRVYQLDLMGTFGTANTSDTFTVSIDLGGTEIAALANAPENAASDPWSMETTFTVRSHGQTGEVQPHSRGVFNSVTKDDHHPTATVDTTVAEMLAVSIDWDAADASNTATLGQAHLKQMA